MIIHLTIKVIGEGGNIFARKIETEGIGTPDPKMIHGLLREACRAVGQEYEEANCQFCHIKTFWVQRLIMFAKEVLRGEESEYSLEARRSGLLEAIDSMKDALENERLSRNQPQRREKR